MTRDSSKLKVQSSKLTPAVFLDRDGTIIEELGYLTPDSALRVFPWSIDAIRLLNRAGFRVVVVTNQGGIGRGLYTCEFVEQTHRALADRFAAGGAVVDAWQYCPHHPEALIEDLRQPCACRKPGTGMVDEAVKALGGAIDLTRSWVVGDQWRDIQLGHAIGGGSILVRSGHGAAQAAAWPQDIAAPTTICDNLMAAVARILA
jgi:D-glycero-D-manno-heptose 1,7-bisphosphate phosphatase